MWEVGKGPKVSFASLLHLYCHIASFPLLLAGAGAAAGAGAGADVRAEAAAAAAPPLLRPP